jgi:hypothetical protein
MFDCGQCYCLGPGLLERMARETEWILTAQSYREHEMNIALIRVSVRFEETVRQIVGFGGGGRGGFIQSLLFKFPREHKGTCPHESHGRECS